MRVLSFITNFWKRTIHIGASEALPADERKRVILTNGMALITCLTAVITILLAIPAEYLLAGSLKLTMQPGLLAVLGCLLVTRCFALNRKGKFIAARYLMLSSWWVFITGMCIVYGEPVRFDHYFLPLQLIPLVIFKKKRHIFTGLAIGILLNAGCQINYRFNNPLIITPPPYADYRFALHSLMMMCLLFAVVYYFRTQNEQHESIIAEEIEIRKMAEQQLIKAKEKAELLACTDFLTGLDNRRSFFDRSRSVLAAAKRHAEPTALLMADIDHFKRINDEYGHAAGDTVLATLASMFKMLVRESDVLARIGGEEFAIMLPRTNTEEAETLAERLRSAAESLAVDHEGLPIRFTLSIGHAGSTFGEKDIDRLMAEADTSLYKAKSNGRNQVVLTLSKN